MLAFSVLFEALNKPHKQLDQLYQCEMLNSREITYFDSIISTLSNVHAMSSQIKVGAELIVYAKTSY